MFRQNILSWKFPSGIPVTVDIECQCAIQMPRGWCPIKINDDTYTHNERTGLGREQRVILFLNLIENRDRLGGWACPESLYPTSESHPRPHTRRSGAQERPTAASASPSSVRPRPRHTHGPTARDRETRPCPESSRVDRTARRTRLGCAMRYLVKSSTRQRMQSAAPRCGRRRARRRALQGRGGARV